MSGDMNPGPLGDARDSVLLVEAERFIANRNHS